ncbi:bifunctional diguanylate cyclase/phosphodiesterase [Bacillus solitudinis]|uniref:bifunctional diguanylate cyclase/phosphodiesterase n=1 Tax=Bacillus solitudinis TaxID=2014074 RepID=UPI0018E21612|nr:EAL domain-containing protein [Bacillus solitudinis]
MFSLPNSKDIVFLEGAYSSPIVFLSIVIACLASYTALSMNERIQQNSFFHHNFWLTLASIAMGLGIWSMHFIGMAAFMLPVSMNYDIKITSLSVVPAIIASFLAFYIASRPKRSIWSYIFSGMIMGLGISAMHYVGMAAMKMEADYVYRPWVFTASVCIAIIVSLVAIYIFSTKQQFMRNFLIKGITAVVMGLAVASMHYTGMEAIIFYVPNHSNQLIHNMVEMDMSLLILGVSVGIFIFLCLTVLSSLLDRYIDYRFNYFDALTKLPNRRQFDKLYKNSATVKSLAILHIHDLETWNSTHGYGFGDEIIRTFGKISLQYKPISVELYRIEGHRFALLMNDSDNIDRLKLAMVQVLSVMSKPFVIHEQLASIKIVCAYSVALKEENVNQLYNNAMAVLNHPTIKYDQEVIEYDPTIHTYTFDRILISDIDQAMERNELYLVYQPKVCTSTNEIVGVEALLRWKHPIHGAISPGVFIPILEEHGKIFDVTDWIIDKVCHQIAEWKSMNYSAWQVAVNIPGPYVTSQRLIMVLKECIKRYTIDGRYLELEITETSVVKNIDNAISAVNILRDYGFTVALDDFGTGVSSLSYLKRLPITTLKIDKSFVDGVPDSENDSAIINAIITLSSSLNLNTVIEGVETKEQVDFLRTISEALIVQGYYFARPMHAEELLDWYEDFKKKQVEFVL